MRKFKVNVNGSVYEVEVEELQGAPAASALAAAPVPAAAPAAPAPAPVVAPAAPVAASAGQETVSSPMPGNILDVKVSVGSAVKSGDVLVILEAMKMENEIRAGRDGKIVAVNVAKGATVESGDALCVIG